MNKFALVTAAVAAVVSSSATAQWSRPATATVPAGRSEPAMAYDATRGEVVMFGGGSVFSFFGDTWVYDGHDWTQRTPATSPSARTEAQMVGDPTATGGVILYGGNIGGGPWGGPASDETWRWDGQNWTQIVASVSPGGRARYGAAFDLARGRMVIYGGLSNMAFPIAEGSTWEFDGTTWAQVTTTASPGPREGVAMCYDPLRGRTILFSGLDPQVGGFADTWSYDGTDWTRLTTNGTPTARTMADMVFDTARGVCLLHGGIDPMTGAGIDETWEFDGVNWTMVASGATVPPDHRQFGMAYDQNRQNTVLFGGVDSSFGLYDQTWEYGASFHAYGSGCSGSLASPTISNLTGPIVGTNFQIDLGGLDPASNAAFMIFGFSRTSTDLTAIGMAGCTLYASSDLIFSLSASGGTASWSLPVPNSIALVGAEFFSQGMAQDATANGLGLVLSAAGASVIGH